jgi:hypothetical protein
MNLRSIQAFFLLSFLSITKSYGQDKKIVYLLNKDFNNYSLTKPAAFLSARAIQRRNNFAITVDSTDLPVTNQYTDSLLRTGNIQLIGQSKWLNAVLLESSDPEVWDKIRNTSFVRLIEDAAFRKSPSAPIDKWKQETITPLLSPLQKKTDSRQFFSYGASETQINLHKGSFLHRLGATGNPLLFAFMDAGYGGYLSNPFLDSTRKKGKILSVKDFVARDNSVVEDNPHGLSCLSIVAGNIPGSYIGSCPDASFILLRSEDAQSEYLIEEFYWAMAAEYADSCGVDIISSALSYTTFDLASQNHRYEEMDGKTTIISRMANRAVSKGMLVVTSAGNDGGNSWKYVGAPADADSVLTVGAVNATKTIADFSSYGPSADKQIKPDVVGLGVGTALSLSNGSLAQASGTSFSTPVIAGLAGCLWQLFPELTVQQLIELIRESSDLYDSPNDRYGYGIPDMRKAVGLMLKRQVSLKAETTPCKVVLRWSSKDIEGMQYILERKRPADAAYTSIYSFHTNDTPFAKRNYEFTDEATSGTFMYRLSQVLDNSVNDSFKIILDSVLISLASECNRDEEKTVVQIYPNPVQDELKIRLTDSDPADLISIVIYNIQGQDVYSAYLSKPGGVYTYRIDLPVLSPGMYMLVLRKEGEEYARKKFLKTRSSF